MKRIVFIVIIVLFSGCSNTVKYIQNVEEVVKEEKEAINRTIAEINGTADSKESLVFNFEYSETRRSTLVKEKYAVNIKQFTPYEGGREFYEFFIGIGGIPVSIVGNIFDFLLFGAIPNELLNTQFYATFAGLNPFINIESEKRSKFEEESRSLTKTDKEEITKVVPLNGETIRLCVNETPVDDIVTDELGKFSIDMFTVLSKARIPEEPRKITIYPAQETNNKEDENSIGSENSCASPGKISLTKYFTRSKAVNLYGANKYLYYLNYLNNEQEPEETANSIIKLSSIGFEEWSIRAEDEIRKRYKDNYEFIDEFSKELKKLLSPSQEAELNTNTADADNVSAQESPSDTLPL